MKTYIVEFTTNENYWIDNLINDWNFVKYVDAKDPDKAVNLVMDYLDDCGEDSEKMLFRVVEIDKYGCNGEWFFM